MAQPANDTEREALRRWREGYPVVAMRTLADAGYEPREREKFLRRVVGLRPSHSALGVSDHEIRAWASDHYIRLID